MKFIYLSFLLLFLISILIVISPIVDHLFYINKEDKDEDISKIFTMVILHIIVLGILVYAIHYYIVKRTIKYLRLNDIYIKVIDLILTLTLTGLQRNLRHKLDYISGLHPIRSKIIE